MRPLHPIDLVFLSLEKKHQPMHVGGLFIFDIPEDAGCDFISELIQSIKTSDILPTTPFNEKLDKFRWKKNHNFHLNYHFKHHQLTQSATLNDLFAYVATQHAQRLDRKEPLWSCQIIDGFAKNKFALFVKVHHALVDGIAAIRLLEKSFSPSSSFKHVNPPWHLPTQESLATQKPVKTLLQKLNFSSTSIVYKELKQALVHERKNNPYYVTTRQAPPCIFNQAVDASRDFHALTLNLKRIFKIAKSLKITINDAILALCSGALKSYLNTQNALPEAPLIAMVPASIRNKHDTDLGNRITMILANLATDLESPIERAQYISQSIRHSKRRFKRMSQGQIFGYSAFVYGMAGANILSGVRPKQQAFNIVISNVPGPKSPLYWNGAALTAIYPASVLFDGQALNITLTTYLDKLEIGLVSCKNLLPNTNLILEFLEQELCSYEALLASTLL